MKPKFRGDTVGKTLLFADRNGAAVDPDEITVVIQSSSGEVVATLDKNDLARVTAGVYELMWNVPVDATLGFWVLRVTGTLVAGDISNTELFTFQVVG